MECGRLHFAYKILQPRADSNVKFIKLWTQLAYMSLQSSYFPCMLKLMEALEKLEDPLANQRNKGIVEQCT